METHSDRFYGKFGGSYVSEMLNPTLLELSNSYVTILSNSSFQKEFKKLLNHYVGRPTPLYYAPHLSEKHQTQIYLKREDLCHTGSHKINNAIGQALLAKYLGKKKIIAETGAGQHGVATATVCALLNLDCHIYMGAKDMERQKTNVSKIKLLGAKITPVYSGSQTLKDATSQAIRSWINQSESYYLIGSVVGPYPYPQIVARLQSIISQEIKEQLQEEKGLENPDYIIACVGGGSNATGAFYHFLDEAKVSLICVEAAGKGVDTKQTAATIKRGSIGILHGSKTIIMQDDYGQIIEPYSISAGLDYPGIGPLMAHLNDTQRVSFIHATDQEALEAGCWLSKNEGIIPALESSHALAGLNQLNFKPSNVVILNLSGRGDKDLHTYIKHR